MQPHRRAVPLIATVMAVCLSLISCASRSLLDTPSLTGFNSTEGVVVRALGQSKASARAEPGRTVLKSKWYRWGARIYDEFGLVQEIARPEVQFLVESIEDQSGSEREVHVLVTSLRFHKNRYREDIELFLGGHGNLLAKDGGAGTRSSISFFVHIQPKRSQDYYQGISGKKPPELEPPLDFYGPSGSFVFNTQQPVDYGPNVGAMVGGSLVFWASSDGEIHAEFHKLRSSDGDKKDSWRFRIPGSTIHNPWTSNPLLGWLEHTHMDARLDDEYFEPIED